MASSLLSAFLSSPSLVVMSSLHSSTAHLDLFASILLTRLAHGQGPILREVQLVPLLQRQLEIPGLNNHGNRVLHYCSAFAVRLL